MTSLAAWSLPLLGALGAVATQALVPRLDEPSPPELDVGQSGWHKPPYASLGGNRAISVAALLGAAAGLVGMRATPGQWPLVLVASGPVTTLCLVDARTTYLPNQLMRPCTALAGLAATAVIVSSPDSPSLAIRLLVCFTATALVFWGVWRFTGALGFGDVRLAPVLALLPGSISVRTWWLYLLAGTTLGALHGVGVHVWRRRHPSALGSVFPYGPSLWLGGWIAVLLS